MSRLRRCVTLDPTPEDSTPQGAEMVLKKDMRYRVNDTDVYPNCAIAFMQMDFPSNDGFGEEYAGTGFLADGHMFITAAHNIVKVDENMTPATIVRVMFGLDGPDDFVSKKKLTLEGRDFKFPKEHQRATDQCDIAWWLS